MRMLVSSAATTPSWYAAGLEGSENQMNHDAAMAAMALGAKTVVIGAQQHGRASEDDIVAAAISVILAALFAIIVVAAAAVLTMG